MEMEMEMKWCLTGEGGDMLFLYGKDSCLRVKVNKVRVLPLSRQRAVLTIAP